MTRTRIIFGLFIGCHASLCAGASSAQPARPAGVVEVGDRLQPILDQHLVQRMNGTRLKMHSPCRREVVFKFDAPWEGEQSAYVSIIPVDEAAAGSQAVSYRMYYRGGGDLGREYTCMAESRDGITWTRPHLGLFEFEGSKDNNIIWTGELKAYFESHNFSPFRDSNPDAGPDELWKAVTVSRHEVRGERKRVLMAFASPDGVHWRRLEEEPIITEGGFDSHNVVFWDANLQLYVCYLRASQQGKRSVARATSKDFINWTRPELLNFGDSPIEQFYTNGIMQYFRAPHVYLGFPMRFVPPDVRKSVGLEQREVDGLSDAVFMSSHDGMRWNRPFMEAYIRPGLDPRNWGGAHGNSTPAWGILQTGAEELSLYWSEHYDNYPRRDSIPQLRRGTLRVDGFVSIHAPYGGGELVTRPLVFSGSRLLLNCSTSAVGSVQVEILEPGGRPIRGFALNECPEIWGDEIERQVMWKGGYDVSSLAGKPVRLRVVMKDADLYAFRFAE